MSKVYAIEGIYWLEDKYEAKEWYKNLLWKDREEALEVLDNLGDDDYYKEIPVYVRHNDIQYLVLIHPNLAGFITTDNEKLIQSFWRNSYTIWYYVKEVELI